MKSALFLMFLATTAFANTVTVTGEALVNYRARCSLEDGRVQSAVLGAKSDATQNAIVACGAGAELASEWRDLRLSCEGFQDMNKSVSLNADFLCHVPGEQFEVTAEGGDEQFAMQNAWANVKNRCGTDQVGNTHAIRVTEWQIIDKSHDHMGWDIVTAKFECLR